MHRRKTNQQDFEQRDFTLTDIKIEKRDNSANMRLTGHASVFNSESVDLGGFVEVVKPGAFERSIAENDVHAFVNHNSDMVIGRNVAGTLRLSEDANGLRTEIDLPDTSYARDLAISVERGDITGMSFGFRVRPGGQTITEKDDGTILRELNDIDLFEVSTTPMPAYPATDVARRSIGLDNEKPEPVQTDLVELAEGLGTARMKSIRDSILLRDRKNQDWYEVRNANTDTVEILMYDGIGMGGTDAKQFVKELNGYKGKDLHIRINSPGGVITDGAAIYNALKRHDGNVLVDIDGLAASMGGIIAMAGDQIRMNHNAFFMMHNASGCCLGEAREMEREAKLLRTMTAALAGTLAQRSGQSKEDVLEMMDKETWLDAQEAKKLGFVDEIMHETREDVRSHDVSHYKNVHSGYLEQRRRQVTQRRAQKKLSLIRG